jgi:hypothetical protein
MTQKGKRRVKSNLDFPSDYQASVPLKGRRRKKKRQERRKDKFNID